jgi:hypothetical protein
MAAHAEELACLSAFSNLFTPVRSSQTKHPLLVVLVFALGRELIEGRHAALHKRVYPR